MEWKNILKEKFSQLGKANYEEILQICLNAYSEGCRREKTFAIEAYRLRCNNLIGNRCMCPRLPGEKQKKICDGKCGYLKQYESDLYKLES